jgi:hypothetical protein
MILGGSFGNLFDRVYYRAVPDFIDFHYSDFHWFVFNVADIFITIGIICLIIVEFILNNKANYTYCNKYISYIENKPMKITIMKIDKIRYSPIINSIK